MPSDEEKRIEALQAAFRIENYLIAQAQIPGVDVDILDIAGVCQLTREDMCLVIREARRYY